MEKLAFMQDILSIKVLVPNYEENLIVLFSQMDILIKVV